MEVASPTFSRNGEEFPVDSSGRPQISFLRLKDENRARADYGDLSSLSESIRTKGFIHAIAIEDIPDPEGHYRVLDGGRRRRAAMNLFASHKDQKFLLVPIAFFSDLEELDRKEIELEANIERKDFEMVEKCELTLQIDRLKKLKYGEGSPGHASEGWTQQKTAELLHVTEATVSRHVKLGEILEKKPKLKKLIKDRKMPLNAALRYAKQLQAVEDHKLAVASGVTQLTSSLQLGDCNALIKQIQSESIGLLLTDPPFGNETITETSGSSRGESGGQSYLATLQSSDNLSPTEVLVLFDSLAPELFRVLKPSAHFYIFYAEGCRDGLVQRLERAGLKVLPPSLIWDKGRNVTAFSGYNYMSSYEPILFGYKPGEPRRRLSEPARNILTYPTVSRELRAHAFHKPPDLVSFLIRQSSLPGETVLDPFAGSGEVLRSAKLLSRAGLGFEISEKNFSSAQLYINEDHK